MIKKAYRLSKASEFARLYAHGKRISSQNFRIFWRTTGFETPQLAVVVSKKVAKQAVDRNRMRRIVFELLQSQLNKLTPSNNIIVLPRSDILTKKHAVIEQELHQLLQKANLLA